MKKIAILGNYNENNTYAYLYNILNIFFDVTCITTLNDINFSNSKIIFTKYSNKKSTKDNDIILCKLSKSFLKNKSFKNTEFDIVLFYSTSYKPLTNDEKSFLNNLSTNTTLIYNADDSSYLLKLNNYLCKKISFGLNSSCDFFPTSMIADDNFLNIMFCINKTILSCTNKSIDSQEFLIKMNILDNKIIYNILSGILCCLILNISITDIVNLYTKRLKGEIKYVK